jgi:hypothetical protein
MLFSAATSDPFAALFGPFLAARVWRLRSSQDLLFAAALGLGLALQAAVVLESAGSRALNLLDTSPIDVVRWYGFHVLQTAAFGVTLRDLALERLGVLGSALVALLVLAPLLAPAVQRARSAPCVPLVLGLLHISLFAAPVFLAGISTSRYTVAPIMLLYSIVAWGLAHSRGQFARSIGGAAIALLALVIGLDLTPSNRRASGPSWTEQLASARASCADGRESVVLVVAPLPAPTGGDLSRISRVWSVDVPCARVLGRVAGVRPSVGMDWDR